MHVPYAAPTRELVHDVLVPIMYQIMADCPPELLPYEMKKGTFRTKPELNWDHGANIVLAGVDLHQDWLRGTDTQLFLFSEAAFVDNLDEVLNAVLLPQLLTNPSGFAVMGSTPPTTPGHTWSTDVVPMAQARGMYTKRTVYDNKRLSPEQIAGAIASCGGEHTTRFRREYLCEHLIESTLAVIPEFVEAESKIVTTAGFDCPPAYRDTYVAIDPGFAHATGAVFGWYDFKNTSMMIEADICTQKMNSSEVARRIKAREWQLWGREPKKPSRLTDAAWKEELALMRSYFYNDLATPTQPVLTTLSGNPSANTFRRISDTDARLVADLANEHGLVFFATAKDDSEGQINALRIKIQDLKYRIHPRCVHLIAHLKQAVWNKSRTKLAEQRSGGHYDCLPALTYLNRNLVPGHNPFPGANYDRHSHHVPSSSAKTLGALAGLFRKGRG